MRTIAEARELGAYRPAREDISSSPGNVGALRYRPVRELIPSWRGSFVVPPGNQPRLAGEGISSWAGRYIVPPRKSYRPLREIWRPFLLQTCGFCSAENACVLYLFVLIVYCVSMEKEGS